MDLKLTPSTDPLMVYRYRDGLYAADLLGCAIIFLDLLTWLKDRPSTKGEICSHFGIAERPTDVMLTLFVAMGLLRREGETIHLNDVAGEHLTASPQWYLGSYYASLKERPVCKDFLQVLKT